MRQLVLILNILVSASLVTLTAESQAMSVSSQTSKNKLKTSKSLSAKKKGLQKNNAIDVWERVRLGMRLPRASPVKTFPVASMTMKNVPVTVKKAEKKSAKVHNAIAAPIAKQATVKVEPGNGLRVRTQLSFHKPQTPQLAAPVIKPSLLSTADLIKPVETSQAPIITQAIVTEKTAITAEKTDGISATTVTMPKQGVENTQNQATQERISKFISWYKQHPEYLYRVTERARPYLYHIVDKLAKHKLPSELALLPIVESAYQPTAQSHKNAAGLWQFIPDTAWDFDLSQSAHYDERLDISASTDAAIKYMSFLRRHYNGDWLLALAAYNCGQGTVDAAMNRNLANGQSTDFWSLQLPEETQDYVPRLLALATIFANPGQYGLKIAPVRNEPYFVEVRVDRHFDIKFLAKKELKTIAQLANLSYEQFANLNPGFLKAKLPNGGPYTFLMPVANARQLQQKLSSYARFMGEPAVALETSPLKKTTPAAMEVQKTPLLLSSMIDLVQDPDRLKLSGPFLSLTFKQGA